jgi:predicted SAM-dependent methyltransferase
VTSVTLPWIGVAGAKIVELGGGDQPMFHPNVDVRADPLVDLVQSLTEPLPYKDLDGIFSKFALEHVSWRQVPAVLKNTHDALKPGGWAVFIVPNTEAQMHWALALPEIGDKAAQCLFGDQDYPENSHKAAFSPAYVFRLFQEAGFDDISVRPFGELKTDMVIEARKNLASIAPAAGWTPEQRKQAYNRHYFDGGRGLVGGYSREGYWDYPAHWTTFRHIMSKTPESVLEIGCARGYVLKRVQDMFIPAAGLEISEHCYLTRVCNGITTWDITQTPWPFKDQEFDLSFSTAVLEHIPEDKMDAVAAEIRRVSKRGLHGVDFGEHDDGFDKTHCLFRDKAWWEQKLGAGQEVCDKESLESGPANPPVTSDLVKLNCGSFTTMFHHGWLNLDIHDLTRYASQYGFKHQPHDLRNGIPVADGSVDLIYAAHFLEHLTVAEGFKFLMDCHRAMKPGATMRLILPDAMKLCREYVAGNLNRYDEMSDGCAGTHLQSRKLWELLCSGHQSMYDAEALCTALETAGFKTVLMQDFRESSSPVMLAQTLDMFPELSMFVEAIK